MNQENKLGPQSPDPTLPDSLKLIYAVQNAEQRGRNEQMSKAMRVVMYHRDIAQKNGANELATILDIIYEQVGPERVHIFEDIPTPS